MNHRGGTTGKTIPTRPGKLVGRLLAHSIIIHSTSLMKGVPSSAARTYLGTPALLSLECRKTPPNEGAEKRERERDPDCGRGEGEECALLHAVTVNRVAGSR